MSFISGLVKRLVKGAPLTAQEGDNNLSILEQALNDLEQAASVFPSADGSTIEIVGGTIREKDLGTTTAKLADGAVTAVKVANDAVTPAKESTVATAVVSVAGAAAIDWSLTWTFYTTLTENTTYSFSNTKEGQTISIVIAQHASSAKTVTWPSIKWSGGSAPVMSIGLAKHDVYTFQKINGIFYGTAVQNCS